MLRNSLLALCAPGIVLTIACSNPATPTTANTSGAGVGSAAAADGSTLKIGAPTIAAPADGFQSPLGSNEQITLVIQNVAGTYTSFTPTYEFEVKNPAGTVVADPKAVASGTGGTSQFTIPTGTLAPDTLYSWRARATLGTAFGPWSTTRTVKGAIPAGIFGQTVLDPLLDGHTFGHQIGGHFIVGQGWQANGVNDGIDYDIPTLSAGTVEFDIANIGQQEGLAFGADLKFLSMGNAPDFADFNSFRDGPWKMHLVQRADNDGLEIVWRDSTDDGTNFHDHRVNMPCCGPKFRADTVNHFVIKWDAHGYSIAASTDGGPLIIYMQAPGDTNDFFIPYAPPQHRISLGCYPRGETIVGAIYRNIKVTPGK
jgi:hypothetical protein